MLVAFVSFPEVSALWHSGHRLHVFAVAGAGQTGDCQAQGWDARHSLGLEEVLSAFSASEAYSTQADGVSLRHSPDLGGVAPTPLAARPPLDAQKRCAPDPAALQKKERKKRNSPLPTWHFRWKQGCPLSLCTTVATPVTPPSGPAQAGKTKAHGGTGTGDNTNDQSKVQTSESGDRSDRYHKPGSANGD